LTVSSTCGNQAQFLIRAPTTTVILREELKGTPAPPQTRAPGKGEGLALNRRKEQAILIGDDIRVVFLKIVTRQRVSVGFEAPKEMQIRRLGYKPTNPNPLVRSRIVN